jgi:3-methyladenine DNA glycosylase AlkD
MGYVLDPAYEADLLAAELRSISAEPVDPAPVIRTSLPFYGVKVGELRRLARGWHLRRPDAGPAEVAALADELWSRAIREEMVLAAFLHGHDVRTRERFGLRTVDRWSRLLDNWETADALGAWLTAPAVADDPRRRFPMLESLAGRRNPWARRIGLVGCLGPARRPGGDEWWPRVAALVLRLADDGEAAIPKAISWVLRSHTRHSPGLVADFVDEHAAALPAVAVRETRNKLKTGRKSGRPR